MSLIYEEEINAFLDQTHTNIGEKHYSNQQSNNHYGSSIWSMPKKPRFTHMATTLTLVNYDCISLYG